MARSRFQETQKYAELPNSTTFVPSPNAPRRFHVILSSPTGGDLGDPFGPEAPSMPERLRTVFLTAFPSSSFDPIYVWDLSPGTSPTKLRRALLTPVFSSGPWPSFESLQEWLGGLGTTGVVLPAVDSAPAVRVRIADHDVQSQHIEVELRASSLARCPDLLTPQPAMQILTATDIFYDIEYLGILEVKDTPKSHIFRCRLKDLDCRFSTDWATTQMLVLPTSMGAPKCKVPVKIRARAVVDLSLIRPPTAGLTWTTAAAVDQAAASMPPVTYATEPEFEMASLPPSPISEASAVDLPRRQVVVAKRPPAPSALDPPAAVAPESPGPRKKGGLFGALGAMLAGTKRPPVASPGKSPTTTTTPLSPPAPRPMSKRPARQLVFPPVDGGDPLPVESLVASDPVTPGPPGVASTSA